MKKWIIGTIECLATILAIWIVGMAVNSVMGIGGVKSVIAIIVTALIILTWSFLNYKKEKHYKFIAYSVGAIATILIMLAFMIFVPDNRKKVETNTANVTENNKMVSIGDIFTEEAFPTNCKFEGSPIVIVKGAFGGTLIELFEAIKSNNYEYVFITGYQDRISGEGQEEVVITRLDDCSGFNDFLSAAKIKGGAIISRPNGEKEFVNTANR